MSTNSTFTIEGARRNRISASTRLGYKSGIRQVVLWALTSGKPELLMPSPETDGHDETLDLRVFGYENFLEFIVWTVRERGVGMGALSGYRSAIKSLYIDQGVPLPEPYNIDMKVIFSGIRKTVAQDLQSGSKEFTGKKPMTFSLFEHLCVISMGLPDCGFTHAYLILSWNLMCRSKSTETIR
ncbi:hypothetical protein AaE_012420 [Aphanomyces astaci]|uniref:Core-binding (CB) domain-containing protein n=2 Tax=Aphanomyces astaci TaxID=112090 RepID=A0A6A4ZRH1_APHAT|nr:hypothetical protein AaE_012420 [Aphanomyces astaci]